MSYYAMVLAGGSGTRFWPMSRRHLPKQLLPLVGDQTMVRQTVERLSPLLDPGRIYVVCGREHKELTARELALLPAENVIDEPMGRDTAAAIGLFAVFLEWKEPGATFAALPADHHITDPAGFQAALRRAFEIAQQGALVTFGVTPTRPATGFGYLEIDGDRVVRFCEKPNAMRAQEFVAGGRHLWNSGMFVWKAAAILHEIETHLPATFAGLKRIQAALGTSAFPAVLLHEYGLLPRISIDYGVMEKASNVRVVRADFGWDDVGSWTAAAKNRPIDANGNVVEALSARVDTNNCVIISSDDQHLLATLGVEDLVVIHTKDATLVCRKDRAEEVKKLVDEIGRQGLERLL